MFQIFIFDRGYAEILLGERYYIFSEFSLIIRLRLFLSHYLNLCLVTVQARTVIGFSNRDMKDGDFCLYSFLV